MERNFLLLFFISMVSVNYVKSHGRLLEPIARTSAWRIDKRFEKNFNDAGMFCGGAYIHHQENEGKCGICGEDYKEKKKYEKGGRYYKGYIMKTYTKGQFIVSIVEILANHVGWFEFRICNIDGQEGDATNECFDKNVLYTSKYHKRVAIGKDEYGERNFTVALPRDLICDHCVFQWKYHAGNSWGKDPKTGRQCVGCGNQEEFYGCSDIRIVEPSW